MFRNILQRKYCWLVLIISMITAYFLVPKKIFNGPLFLLGILYIITFSVVSTCLVRTIKEKTINMKNTGASLVSIVAAVLGIGAMQVCGIGAPICGATIGVGIFSLFFGEMSIAFLSNYAVAIIIISILIQFLALYYMKCFNK